LHLHHCPDRPKAGAKMAKKKQNQSVNPPKGYWAHQILAKQYGVSEEQAYAMMTPFEDDFTRYYGKKALDDPKRLMEAKTIEEIVAVVESIETFWANMQTSMTPDLPGQVLNELIYRINRFREIDGDIPDAPINWQGAATWVVNTKRYLQNPTKKSTESHKPSNDKLPEWSKIMSKQEITTALGLSSVYKLNTLIEQKVYEVKQVGKNRQSWQIRIDKLPGDIKKKLKP
jgi:hypothetical protein